MKNFYPFEKVYETTSDIEPIIELLDLSKVQRALLWQMLRRFEINVWFEEGDDKNNPCLTINTFWDMNHVASMSLTEFLKDVVTQVGDIEIDQEMIALTKLKSLIEQAIVSRQQQNDA